MSSEPNQNQELFLTAKLEQDPSDWDTRQQLAHLLYDKGQYGMAAAVVWEADQIPSTDLDLAFAARILSKDQPRKAIRLLTAVLELNKGKAVQNMGMANALLHHGMVLQAARFYGAALEADPELVNPDLEHFILWTDEEQTLWGDFKDRRPKLGELPWMSRDPMEALKLTSRVSLHTTPIAVPKLRPVLAEDLRNSLYQQEAKKGAKITPPPAVTIPSDRVDPKHRRFDSSMGAESGESTANPAPSAKKADPNATQEVQIQKPATSPASQVEAPAAKKAVDPDATQEVEITKPADAPTSEVKTQEPPKAPAAIPVEQSSKPETKDDSPAADKPKAATPPPAPMSRPAAPAAGKMVVGPDGKLRRAKAEPDMDAIEAAAKAELAEKARIANIAKAAANDADEQDDIERAARINTSKVNVPGPPQSATGKEQLPPADRNAQQDAAKSEDGISDEERAAREEEMKKTRAIARAAAREKRLNAAAAGVPLPATEGRKGEWYFIHNDEAVGPVLAEELKEKMNDPTLKPPLKMIWTGGMDRWMPIYECPELWEELDGANA